MPCGVTRPRHRSPGAGMHAFTLVEVLVTLAILAIVVAIAVPSYADHVRRARIVEVTTRLADHRVQQEQYFLDNRRYDDGAGECVHPAPAPAPADAFALTCTATASTYQLAATGIAGRGMEGFVYTIDHDNARATPSVPTGWVRNDRCWVIRRDGTCG
jgi:type IV pilus assembly protein PilE